MCFPKTKDTGCYCLVCLTGCTGVIVLSCWNWPGSGAEGQNDLHISPAEFGVRVLCEITLLHLMHLCA